VQPEAEGRCNGSGTTVSAALRVAQLLVQELLGDDTPAVQHHLEFLSHEAFFTSPRLAQISTQAEILAKEVGAGGASSAVLEVRIPTTSIPLRAYRILNPLVLSCRTTSAPSAWTCSTAQSY
jgi:hypothetical protein